MARLVHVLALASSLAVAASCFVDQGPGAATTAGESTGGTSTSASTTTTTTTTTTSTTATMSGSATTTGDSSVGSTSDPDTTTGASTGDPDTTTGAAAPTLCGLPLDGWTFTEPTPLAAVNTTSRETDPWFMPGDLRLLFASSVGGNSDLWRSERVDAAAPWGAPVLAGDLGVNGSGNESHAILTADEVGLVLATDRAGGAGGTDLWVGIRASVDDPFANLLDLPDINAATNEYDPWLSADGLRLYFNVQDNSGSRVVVSERPTGDTFWVEVAAVEGIAEGTSVDSSAFLLEDERLIFFTSLRAGTADVWWAAREDRTLPFEAPTLAPTINLDDAYEGELAFSGDGCEVVFSSSRGKLASDWDLYQARVVAR